MRCRWVVMGLLVCSAVTWSSPTMVHAQNREDDALSKIAAAFVFNFAQYTQWPDGAFEDNEAPVQIAVVGSERFTRLLTALVRGRRIGDRPVRVERVTPPALPAEGVADEEEARQLREAFAGKLRQAHVVYVDDEHAAPTVLELCRGHAVLTVGFVPRFAHQGGMLGLKQREGHMVFDANPAAIRDAGLEVSSKVLRLAEIVGEDE